MDAQKIEGLVLSIAKYKDYDCIATVLTPNGVRRVKFTGVRRPKAKFGFAAQPFCHAEFLLSSDKEYAVVVGVDQKSDFFPLTQNIDAYMAASEWLKLIRQVATENQDCESLYQTLLVCLSVLLVPDVNVKVVDCWFRVQLLVTQGLFSKNMVCAGCETKLINGAVLDVSTGALYCPSCAPQNGLVMSKNVLEFVSGCATKSLSELLCSCPAEGVVQRSQELISKILV